MQDVALDPAEFPAPGGPAVPVTTIPCCAGPMDNGTYRGRAPLPTWEPSPAVRLAEPE
ncbi:hypothetical protein [Sciscionella marina]|uniref:hypothetical protein n=1 Tax=Sciscionella marina TaxID=508770 RepID=UPI000367F559|nr:hypothetical protein [Sciscionella marina]